MQEPEEKFFRKKVKFRVFFVNFRIFQGFLEFEDYGRKVEYRACRGIRLEYRPLQHGVLG
jgi:hypothetical protein